MPPEPDQNPSWPPSGPLNTPASPQPVQPSVPITPPAPPIQPVQSWQPPTSSNPNSYNDVAASVPAAAPLLPPSTPASASPATVFNPIQPASPSAAPTPPSPPAQSWPPAPIMPDHGPTTATQPGAVVSFHTESQGNPIAVNNPGKTKHSGSKKKKLLVSIFVLLLLGGGAAAAYFGIYMSPSFIWQQSLGDSNKAYGNLVDYLNTASKTHYSGAKETGTFKVTSGDNNFDGSLDAQSDGNSAMLSAKLDLGVTKLDLEERSVKAAGATQPDEYLQVSGIKALGGYLGPSLGPKFTALDGKWIVIDHNLIADLQKQLIKQQKAQSDVPKLTWQEIDSFLQAAGKVNKQYVFTTSSKTAVTKIVQKYGIETLAGHKTYHYKIGFVNAHVKAYITAMCGALQQSDLGSYIKQQTGKSVATSSTCKDLEKSADNIKSSDTIDVWVDISHRLIYKVRVPDTANPAQNFADIGLDYKGGSSYPFFLSGQSEDKTTATTFSVIATLDSKTNSVSLAATVAQKGGTSPFAFSSNFNFQPSNDKVNVTAPTGAEPITDVLNSFGLGGYLTALQKSATNAQTTAAPFSAQSLQSLSKTDQAKLISLIQQLQSGSLKSVPALQLVRFMSQP